MSDDIRPALTPEEWGEHEIESHYCGNQTSVQVDHKRRIFVHDNDDRVVVVCEASIGEHVCLGVAALCLHDHPQGFTHKDVRVLRWLASQVAVVDYDIDSLAARIEALLPPEGTEN